jgi:uncharacterized membrane protein
VTARLSLLLPIAGLLVSGYLTYAHFNADALVCAESAVIDCAAVTSSDQSELFGIPVALLGLLFFAEMTVLCLPWARRIPILRWVRLGSVGVGVLMVVHLVAAELLLIGKICLWCTVVHVITLVLAGLLVFEELRPSSLEPPLPDSPRPPGVYS